MYYLHQLTGWYRTAIHPAVRSIRCGYRLVRASLQAASLLKRSWAVLLLIAGSIAAIKKKIKKNLKKSDLSLWIGWPDKQLGSY